MTFLLWARKRHSEESSAQCLARQKTPWIRWFKSVSVPSSSCFNPFACRRLTWSSLSQSDSVHWCLMYRQTLSRQGSKTWLAIRVPWRSNLTSLTRRWSFWTATCIQVWMELTSVTMTLCKSCGASFTTLRQLLRKLSQRHSYPTFWFWWETLTTASMASSLQSCKLWAKTSTNCSLIVTSWTWKELSVTYLSFSKRERLHLHQLLKESLMTIWLLSWSETRRGQIASCTIATVAKTHAIYSSKDTTQTTLSVYQTTGPYSLNSYSNWTCKVKSLKRRKRKRQKVL